MKAVATKRKLLGFVKNLNYYNNRKFWGHPTFCFMLRRLVAGLFDVFFKVHTVIKNDSQVLNCSAKIDDSSFQDVLKFLPHFPLSQPFDNHCF